MKMISYSFRIAGILLGLTTIVSADPPRKPSVGQFTRLISQSPFTIKPAPPGPSKVETPLERDWMLGSIRPNANGYSVTLINKKDRKERVRFLPGFSTGEFQLLEVKQDPNNNFNSRVRVRKGSQTAWLTYDEKLIKVRPSAVAKKSTSATARRTPTSSQRSRQPSVPGRSSSSGKRPSRQRSVPRTTR